MSILGNVTEGLKGQAAKAGAGSDLLSKGLGLAGNAESLKALFSSDVVKKIADKVGMSPETLQTKLPALLPQVIEALSVDGKFDPSKIDTKKLIGTVTGLLKN